jgi:putative transposase
MKRHLPAGFWEKLFRDIDEQGLSPDVVKQALGLSNGTFYRKRRQYYSGGVEPRKPGSGRKRVYLPETYEPQIKKILETLPPVSGHRRIWMAMKRQGVPFCQGTAYRIMRDLHLLVAKQKGRCRKRYEPIQTNYPNDLWMADTTTWWIGRQRVEIYLCLDAHSRYIPALMFSLDRAKESTLRYYEKLFEEEKPLTLHTDNGTEFTNRDALALLELREIEWRSGPSYTPEAQGLVERLVKTLKEEWLMWKEPTDTIELQKSLEEFRSWYNGLRDHSALNYRVPEEVYYART